MLRGERVDATSSFQTIRRRRFAFIGYYISSNRFSFYSVKFMILIIIYYGTFLCFSNRNGTPFACVIIDEVGCEFIFVNLKVDL